ncbi:unnamed protein product [Didymodactylos carnosus]|uniref:Uncharacterized protein n=1 Tax=Didymodactylos carnosus TaxID=1234261 RepID=A0A8S2IWT5_9BILA|nr:unnamed protein product [Didymodactylos carnosus]CAF3767039.1 unnamed protein product [Didymodactylos carnosus]
MGVGTSMCRRGSSTKKHVSNSKNISSSSRKAQCLAISREPTNPTLRTHQSRHTPQRHQFTTLPPPVHIPHLSQIPTQQQTYRIAEPLPKSSLVTPDRSGHINYNYIPDTRVKVNTSTSDIVSLSSSDILHHIPCSEHVHDNRRRQQEEKYSYNEHERSRLMKRSASVPIDMFLIDISHEHAMINQPITLNIRHLLLDTIENRRTNSSSSSLLIEPSSITTYAHDNLLNYIPYVCERYPNVTVSPNQPTRNTLHVRVPSQFSKSLNEIA